MRLPRFSKAKRPQARRSNSPRGRGQPAPQRQGRRRSAPEDRWQGSAATPERGGKLAALARHGATFDALSWLGAAVLIHWLRSGGERRPTIAGQAVADASHAEKLQPHRGRSADHPLKMSPRAWADVAWRTWQDFNSNAVGSIAGAVAWFTVLAAFPTLSAFVSLYGLFLDVGEAQKQLSLLYGLAPPALIDFLRDQMLRLSQANTGGLSFTFVASLLLSIWSANAGMKALIVGLNITYGEKEKRNFIQVNLRSLSFTVGLIVFLVVVVAGLVVAPSILAALGQSRFVGLVADLLMLNQIILWARWPLLLLMMTLMLTLIYRYGPSRQPARWRWVTPGGLLASVLWLLASGGFSFYLANFTSYDKTYGAIGAIIGVMTWTWLSAVVVLLGAEFDAELEHQTAVDTTTGPPLPIGQRGAAMADGLGKARG